MKTDYYLRASLPLDLSVGEWRKTIPTKDALKLHMNEDCYVLLSDIENRMGIKFRPDEFHESYESFDEEMAPRSSRERTVRSFHEEDVTCFYDSVDIDDLTKKFDQDAHTPRRIRVFFRETEVTPEELTDDLFEQFTVIAERMGIEYCAPYQSNVDVFQSIRKAYNKKERRLQPLSKEQLFSVPIRRSGIVKGLAASGIGIAISTGLTLLGQLFSKAPDWRIKAAGVLLIGLSGVGGVLFRQQAAVVAEHAYSNPILADSGEEIHYAE